MPYDFNIAGYLIKQKGFKHISGVSVPFSYAMEHCSHCLLERPDGFSVSYGLFGALHLEIAISYNGKPVYSQRSLNMSEELLDKIITEGAKEGYSIKHRKRTVVISDDKSIEEHYIAYPMIGNSEIVHYTIQRIEEPNGCITETAHHIL